MEINSYFLRINSKNTICYYNSESLETSKKLLKNTMNALKIQNNKENIEYLFSSINNIDYSQSRSYNSNILVNRILKLKNRDNITIVFENLQKYFYNATSLNINSETIKLISHGLVYVLSRLDCNNKKLEDSLKNDNLFKQQSKKIKEEDIIIQNIDSEELLCLFIGIFTSLKVLEITIQDDFMLNDNNIKDEINSCFTLIMLHFDWLFPNVSQLKIDLNTDFIFKKLISENHEKYYSQNPDDHLKSNNLMNSYINKTPFDDFEENKEMDIPIDPYDIFNNSKVFIETNLNKLFKLTSINSKDVTSTNNNEDSFHNIFTQFIFSCFLIEKYIGSKPTLKFKNVNINIPYSYSSECINSLNYLFKSFLDNKSIQNNPCSQKIININEKCFLNENFNYLSFFNNNNEKVLSLSINILDSNSFLNSLCLIKRSKLKDLSITILPQVTNLYSNIFLEHICNCANYNIKKLKSCKNSAMEIRDKIDIILDLMIPSLESNLEMLLIMIEEKQLLLKHLDIDFTLNEYILNNDRITLIMFKFLISIFHIILNKYSQLETISIASKGFPLDTNKFPMISELFPSNKPKKRLLSCIKSLRLDFFCFKLDNISTFLTSNIEYLTINSIDSFTFVNLYSNLHEMSCLSFLSLKLIGFDVEYETEIFIKFFKLKKPNSLRTIELKSNYEIIDTDIIDLIRSTNYDYVTKYYIEIKLRLYSVILFSLLNHNTTQHDNVINKPKSKLYKNFRLDKSIDTKRKVSSSDIYFIDKNTIQNEELLNMKNKIMREKLKELINDESINMNFMSKELIKVDGLKSSFLKRIKQSLLSTRIGKNYVFIVKKIKEKNELISKNIDLLQLSIEEENISKTNLSFDLNSSNAEDYSDIRELLNINSSNSKSAKINNTCLDKRNKNKKLIEQRSKVKEISFIIKPIEKIHSFLFKKQFSIKEFEIKIV